MVNRMWIALLCVPYLLMGVDGDPFILCTIPKSGTYLSIKFMKLMSGAKERMIDEGSKDFFTLYPKKFANGTFNFMHFRHQFDPKVYKVLMRDIVPILNVRDPRDVCVSNVFYFSGILNQLCGADADFNERLSFTIQYQGYKSYFGPLFFFRRAVDLIDNVNPVVLRFEDLTGPQGGGSLEAQLNTIYSTAARLNIPMSEERALAIADQLFGNSPTFREGQIGSWKTYFTEEHKAQFKASGLQPYLIRLGYETDDQW